MITLVVCILFFVIIGLIWNHLRDKTPIEDRPLSASFISAEILTIISNLTENVDKMGSTFYRYDYNDGVISISWDEFYRYEQIYYKKDGEYVKVFYRAGHFDGTYYTGEIVTFRHGEWEKHFRQLVDKARNKQNQEFTPV